jgi:HAD superfamily hydrolase (TIGR01509 family)
VKQISVILFDFVGVLLVPDAGAETNPLIEAVDARIGKVVDDTQFVQQALQDFSLDQAQFQGVLDGVVQKYQPYAPLWNALPALKQHFRFGIINNGTWLTYPRFNKRFRLEDAFDMFVSSAVEGVRKPDPRIYLRACEKLGVSPEECLFMDDSKENVAGAAQVGLQAMHWNTPDNGYRQFAMWVKRLVGIDIGQR